MRSTRLESELFSQNFKVPTEGNRDEVVSFLEAHTNHGADLWEVATFLVKRDGEKGSINEVFYCLATEYSLAGENIFKDSELG